MKHIPTLSVLFITAVYLGLSAAGQSNECFVHPCDLPLQSVALSSDFELWYNVDQVIGGVQLELDLSAELTGVGGGIFETLGFYETFSNTTYLAFSLEGTDVPGGCGVLTQFSVVGPDFYIDDLLVAAPGGNGIVAVEVINDGAPLACTAGCMDPVACNYIATATVDDGSCAAEDLCGECGGNNSSCSGCTYENATNYDSSATIEDGSCLYNQDAYDAALEDCPECINENQIDEGFSCIEIWEPVCGCNDVTYSNECYAFYNGVTEWTDGECDLSNPYNPDSDNDNIIGVNDLLALLSFFGNSFVADCGNGIVEDGECCDDGNDIETDGCNACMCEGSPQDE